MCTWSVEFVIYSLYNVYFSDGEGREGNPMVAGFQDDLDPDDVELEPTGSVTNTGLYITISSDEEGPKPTVEQDEDLVLEPHKHL